MLLSGWGMNLICYQLSYVNRYEYTLVHGYKQVMILDVPTKSTDFSCTIGKPSCSPCSVIFGDPEDKTLRRFASHWISIARLRALGKFQKGRNGQKSFNSTKDRGLKQFERCQYDSICMMMGPYHKWMGHCSQWTSIGDHQCEAVGSLTPKPPVWE